MISSQSLRFAKILTTLALGAVFASCRDTGTEPQPGLQLRSVVVAPSSISLAAPSPRLEISVSAKSDDSEINVVAFRLRRRNDPNYGQYFGGGLNLSSGTRRDGVWLFSITAPSGFYAMFQTPGAYYVGDLELKDRSGAVRKWTDAELAKAGHKIEVQITP